jgi:centromere protein I
LYRFLKVSKHPDPQWRERLDEIQEAHYHKSQGGPSQPRDGFRVHRPIGRSARNKIVPLVHTSHATEVRYADCWSQLVYSQFQDAVTLEEIENATGFVKNLDKLELPNQLIAVLADPLLQKLMLLKPGHESEQRIANWLNAVLQDVHDGDADEATFFDMLDILRDYVVSVKACFFTERR